MAFGNVLVGGTTIQADAKTDTLEIVAGTNIALTPDATNDRLTIGVTGTVGAATTAGTCTGNAATATTLQTARSIGISGDIVGTASSFNGGANITIPATLASSGVTAGTYTSVTVDAKGRVTAGSNPASLGVSITGNAATATKLATTRALSLTGDVTGTMNFDGSTNASMTTMVANDSHFHSVATLQGVIATNVWISDYYTPVKNTPTIVSHGISGLNPFFARAEVFLQCVVAEHGYSVGDCAMQWGLTRGESSNVYMMAPIPFLSESEVSIVTGYYSTGINVQPKNSGSQWGGAATLSNWRYIFRIWY